MQKISVRIENISIENFKNVKMGSISLENKRKAYRASIVGLYGQNGSGKTALVDSIALLKLVLCGQQVPPKYADYINVDAESAKLVYQFKMLFSEGEFDVWYEFCLKKVIDDTAVNMQLEGYIGQQKVEVFAEVLSFSFTSSNEKIRKSALIDTRTEGVFLPKTKCGELVAGVADTDLMVIKKIVKTTSRCFIFSREMINIFLNNCKNDKYKAVIEGLMTYGNKELFVINTENNGLISLNALPLAFKYKDSKAEAVGNLMLTLNAPAIIPNEALGIVTKVIDNMNIVLAEIIPGLTIGINDLGNVAFQGNKPGKAIQLMSLKNGKAIAFQYESEGIKKIVSILQLLIVVYNNPSITVAVDELDAGIFEYLLGEILHIIAEKGKGQLIFTSHNLRPLETIDKGFIAFTTANPENRYVRMTNVKGNNNLRDFYYRDIVLGEQSEKVYNPTNNFDIALAFREAGEPFDT